MVNLRQRFGREAVKLMLAPLLHWQVSSRLEPGFSIILAVPWDLRHLLPVNLQFISRTDLRELSKIHVVFDRTPRLGAEKLIDDVRYTFPQLPVTFRYHDRLSGSIIEKVNSAAFYHAMCCILGLTECRTRYAVLHDFDLYPLVPNYFQEIVHVLESQQLHFSGPELSSFCGLTESDCLIGTWALGIDVEWLRSHHRPVECFHQHHRLGGRLLHLDPFSYVQSQTPRRAPTGTIDASAFCHAKNLCSTYLQFISGQKPNIVWRLHYLWYLEHLGEHGDNLLSATRAMNDAKSSVLNVGRCQADFSRTDPTCANVLRSEIDSMERMLFGACRPEVQAYVTAFDGFLRRFGQGVPATEHRDVAVASKPAASSP